MYNVIYKWFISTTVIGTFYADNGTLNNFTSEVEKPFFDQPAFHCILPPPPKDGNYTIVKGHPSASGKPGSVVNSYTLRVLCNPGFQLSNQFPGGDIITCSENVLTQMPKCLPLCKLTNRIVSIADQKCYLSKTDGVSLEPSGPQSQHADDDMCGVAFVSVGTSNLSFGRKAVRKELPWQAGVYSKLFHPYKQICGGSLVSTSIVISAAHCFWADSHQLPAENYAVAVGKIYRPWNDKQDVYAQKSDVSEIHIPPRFLGFETRFQEDLALLVLATPVSYSPGVRPVCLNFDEAFHDKQLKRGALGKVGGWGLRSEDGPASPTLQVAEMPYIDIHDCVASSEPAFREHITSDKICAGYTNGTAVCKGDSGGGLSFPVEEADGLRYFLRGVVSTAPGSEHLCSVYHWATFTDLQRHQHFIQKILVPSIAFPPRLFDPLLSNY